ncbi:endolytic transglycosylase MltG [Alkalicoccus chagannorensis]|uniref:endolytic transglycosylase MltG n=1 Tax=Alkalicoccus chagannorensis TaxID=427072 RepID=UPI00040066F9|nr:endolytic transglycosylase MltG [Alkalicoccus chagannorensis]
MKRQLQGAAAGCLFSGAVLAALYVSGLMSAEEESGGDGQTDETDVITVDEHASIIEDLENDIERLSQELTAAEAEEPASSTADPEEQQENEEREEELIYVSLLEIESGMTSEDVVRELARQNIIDSRNAFTEALRDSGSENEIQTGTYEVRSDMTEDEIMDLIVR